LESIQHGGRQEIVICYLATSRQYGNALLGVRHQEEEGSLRKSDDFTPNGGAKYKGVAIFDQYAAISRKGYNIEAYLVTMEDEYTVVCALSNSATFDDLE